MGSEVKSYRDLIIWQRGVDLTMYVYALTETFPRFETYGLADQLRRSAVSIPSNIAEGQARRNPKDFARFLRIALGSSAEVDTQIVIAQRLGYVTRDEAETIVHEIDEIRRMTYTLINRLNTSN